MTITMMQFLKLDNAEKAKILKEVVAGERKITPDTNNPKAKEEKSCC